MNWTVSSHNAQLEMESGLMPVVYRDKLDDLLQKIMKESNLEFERMHLKIGLDSGGDLLKN